MNSKNKIPLRQFYKNIDDYIINQASDMAISYSLYLLEKFPKNITVYQLLGKAYLDLKEFDKALFLFEKVLEIEPDDFISHVGISLITENFGNVDRALSSMMRAYELQPANESLQNEVKRLTEAKDGFAPEKIRLTRGALIKMYSRSKLTEQAIAEAKLGLHESPDRVDYKVLLAKMLQEAGNESESTEKCMEILSSHPYCRPALEIVFKNLVSLDNEADAGFYKERISELDPYFAYMNPNTDTVNNIPDIAVMVEETGLPKSEIDDVVSFIKDIWDKPESESPVNDEVVADDWDVIIEEAVSNDGIGEPIEDLSIEEVTLETEETETKTDEESVLSSDEEAVFESHEGDEYHDMTLTDRSPSKVDRFKQRLQVHHESGDDQESNEIPEWIRDGVAFEENIEENAPAPPKTGEFEEDGMTDHQIPVNPDIESENFMDNMSDWENEPVNDLPPNLDDTQRIKILKSEPEEIKDQFYSALDENDTEFAFRCIDALTKEDYALKEIAEKLEDYLARNPKNIELWLKLVRVYHDLDDKQNAIAALEKAQINISI